MKTKKSQFFAVRHCGLQRKYELYLKKNFDVKYGNFFFLLLWSLLSYGGLYLVIAAY